MRGMPTSDTMSCVRSPFSSSCVDQAAHHCVHYMLDCTRKEHRDWTLRLNRVVSVPPGTPKSARWCPAPGSGPRSHIQVPPTLGPPAGVHSPFPFFGSVPGAVSHLIWRKNPAVRPTHPVACTLGFRTLYGLYDAAQIAIKVERPLIQVACGDCGKAMMHSLQCE